MSQQATPNPVELFEKATSGISKVLAGVNQNQADSQTPCSEWKVKDLIEHLIGGASHLNASISGEAGQGGSQSGGGDISGLTASYNSVIQSVLQNTANPSALQAKVQTPAGEMEAGQFIGILSLDNLVHTWDLAKATGQAANLDPALTEACYGMFVPGLIDMARPHGAFGPAVSVPDSASVQDKLIAYTGRQP